MENPEEVLQTLDEFAKLKPKDIPKELEDYLTYVAKTGDPVYQWSLVKSLFREKLLNVITDFYEGCPSVDLPPCPNVDTFNYETMKERLIERLELFANAPFTVQRLCELLTSPKKQYSRADKFMRAVEKNIMVVSTREPGQVRRNDSSQPDLVNGVVETTGLEDEPSRVSLELAETVGSSATSTNSFLSNEGSVQVIFEDSSLDKNNSPTKCYEETYEDGVPRRAPSWFRERVESPDKLSPFGSQIHSHVSTRIDEESDVDVGNQLAEKYHGPVADRGIVEDDDDDIDEDYVEPTRNVAHFHSQESNPTLLGLESADDYCGPPSPEEENSETTVAVSTIAEETPNTIPVTSILDVEEPLQKESSLPSESTKEDSLVSSLPNSETSDIKTDKLKPESPSSLETTNNVEDEKEQNSVMVELIDESATPVPSTCSETLTIDSKSEQPPSNDTKSTDLDSDNMEVPTTSSDAEAVSVDTIAFEPSKDETESCDEIPALKSKSPEPTVVEPLEPETTVTDDIAKESTESIVDADSTVKIVECDPIKESEPVEAETIEMSILDSLGPITPEDSLDVVASEVPVIEEVGLPASEPLNVTSTDSALDEPTEKTGTEDERAEDEMATKPESPVKVSEEVKTETAIQVTEETLESIPSVEEERDREMMIQNERIESVIQENVDQTPQQEEILVQQIFVPHEVPMDEKTSECEPEAMEVDENSQSVEEPMEQGDNSPTIS